MITAAEWDVALRLLSGCDEADLACHVGPDGDALGSMLALGLALREQGTRVRASFGSEPFAVPRSYSFLPGLDLLVRPEELAAAPRLLVTLDTSSRDRLGSLAGRVATAEHVLVIDHHASCTRFGTAHLVDADAASTASVVADVVDRLGLTTTADVATALYTGLVTDTGSFKHAATTPAVHALAGRLLETGIRPDLITRAIYDTAPFAYVQLLGQACSRARLEVDAVGGLGLVWTVVEVADLARHGLALSDTEGVIDVLRASQEAEVAVVLKGDPGDGLLKVSTRSKGRVDVGAVCSALGGGGHRFAAGFTAHGDVDDAMAALRAGLAAAPHLTP